MTKVKLASALTFKTRPLMGSVIESRFTKESEEFHRCFVLFIQEQITENTPTNLEGQDIISELPQKKFNYDSSWLRNKVALFMREYGTFIFIMFGVVLVIVQFINKGYTRNSTRTLELEIRALREDVNNLLDLLEKEVLSLRGEIRTSTELIINALGKRP